VSKKKKKKSFGNLILPHPATRDDFFGLWKLRRAACLPRVLYFYFMRCTNLRSFDFDPLFLIGRLSPDPDLLTSDRGGLVGVERKENAPNKTEHLQDR
jgi:hypothetical protein